jgi:RNA-directed DNA polymerase
MLVLEPIFEADLPPEQYAYRPGCNAQQAVVEVGALLARLAQLGDGFRDFA